MKHYPTKSVCILQMKTEPPIHGNLIHNRIIGKPIIFVHYRMALSSSSSDSREVVSIIGEFVEVTSDNIKEQNDLVKKRSLTL